MRRERNKNEEHDDGSYVVKKSRRSSIIAFILCVLISFVIWAYASATEEKSSVATDTATESVVE